MKMRKGDCSIFSDVVPLTARHGPGTVVAGPTKPPTRVDRDSTRSDPHRTRRAADQQVRTKSGLAYVRAWVKAARAQCAVSAVSAVDARFTPTLPPSGFFPNKKVTTKNFKKIMLT